MKEYNHITDFTHDIIIIGGGTAGLTLAEGASRLGLKTILLENKKVGGNCLYNGCIPAKNLIKFSAMYSNTVNSELYKSSMFKTPEPDIRSVMDQVNDVIEQNELYDSEERLTDLGAEVLHCSPKFLNKWQLDTGLSKDPGVSDILSSGKIIIATGSRPYIPDILGLNKTDYMTNLDFFSMNKLPGEMIIIGGGIEGTIMGQAMARMGVSVTILEQKDQILGRHDSDIAELVESALEAEGIKFIKNVTVMKVEQKGHIKTVYYKNAEGHYRGTENQLMADSLLIAAGRRGNTETLKLNKAGINTVNGFIRTDDHLRTESKNIYAIGDVNGKFLYTHVAGAEASYLLNTLEMKMPGKFNYLNIPWCTYTDPGTASIGYNVRNAEKAGIKFRVAVSDYPELENSGRIKILIDSRDRIIGTQIAGPNADQLLIPSIIAFNRKLKFMDILSPVYPYPAVGAAYKSAADSIYNEKEFSLHSKKMLKFMYRYRGRQE